MSVILIPLDWLLRFLTHIFILAKPKSHEGGKKHVRSINVGLRLKNFTNKIPVLFWENHFTSLATDLHLQPATLIDLLLSEFPLDTCTAQTVMTVNRKQSQKYKYPWWSYSYGRHTNRVPLLWQLWLPLAASGYWDWWAFELTQYRCSYVLVFLQDLKNIHLIFSFKFSSLTWQCTEQLQQTDKLTSQRFNMIWKLSCPLEVTSILTSW